MGQAGMLAEILAGLRWLSIGMPLFSSHTCFLASSLTRGGPDCDPKIGQYPTIELELELSHHQPTEPRGIHDNMGPQSYSLKPGAGACCQKPMPSAATYRQISYQSFTVALRDRWF